MSTHRLENWAQALSVTFEQLGDWLEARRLSKRRPPKGPPPAPFENIVLHGGPRNGLCMSVQSSIIDVNIPAPPDERATFLEEGEGPAAPKFDRYVYKRQTYRQVIDGVDRVVYLSDGVKHA